MKPRAGLFRGTLRVSRLPAWSLPLARRIVPVGPLPVLATGAGAVRGLRVAGAQAAATSSAIYVERVPERSPESVELLAHELSHVADRPVLPRFFLDRAVDAEEERARSVGAEARRAWEESANGSLGEVPATLERTAPGRLHSSAGLDLSPAGLDGGGGPATGSIVDSGGQQAAGEGAAREKQQSAAEDPNGMLCGLLEALEERLLREIERRGGRFAGAF